MRVLQVCAEVYPLLKTGGLADVTGALPPALARLGCDVRMLLPGFPAMMEGVRQRQMVAELAPRFGAAALRLHLGMLPNGMQAYIIEAPGLFDREGNPYVDGASRPYPDNYRRFALLGWMAAQLATGVDGWWNAALIHGHDWHAGLAPAYLRAWSAATGRRSAGTIFTVHNLAYQGLFPSHVQGELELPAEFFQMYGLEFYGQFSFMKAGLFYSDKLTTVSPTYAKEIQEPEQGCGLEGLLHSRSADLHGILNGVDPEIWNPASDRLIAANYDSDAIAGKAKCKQALQQETGLKQDQDAPLFAIVSRLTEQKGLHLVLPALEEIIGGGGQLVLLGSGDATLESAFRAAAVAHPQCVSVQIGYDEEKSHRIIAGSDAILVPSRFEPCGLTQLYGLIYGTLPVVRRVGGLADSVVDCTAENMAAGVATGFVFDGFDTPALSAAIRRVFALYPQREEWIKVQRRAMQQQFSWDAAASRYMQLYGAVGE